MDRYEEALERAKCLYSQHGVEWRDEDIEYIFPELKKSEDENKQDLKNIDHDNKKIDPWEFINKFNQLYGHYPKDADEIEVIVSNIINKTLNISDDELKHAKKDAFNDALDKIEYNSDQPTFDDGWSAAINYIKKKYIK